jgi:hypothetical protein
VLPLIGGIMFYVGFATSDRPRLASSSQSTEIRQTAEWAVNRSGETMVDSTRSRDNETPQFPPSSLKPASTQPASVDAVFAALGEMTYCGRAHGVRVAIERLNADEVSELLAQIESVGRFDQWHILPRAIDRLMTLEPARAIDWMEEKASTFREGSATFVQAFELIAKRDADAGLKYFEKLPPGDRKNLIGASLLSVQAQKSPEAALAFLKQLPPGAGYDAAAIGYVKGLAKADPEKAITSALRWRDGNVKLTTLTSAFGELAKSAPARALVALDQVTEPDQRAKVFNMLVSSAQDKDLPALAEYYERAVRENPEMNRWVNTLSRVAGGIAKEDPKAALAWAAKLPEKEQAEGMERALSVWSWSDPKSALQWNAENTADDGAKKRRDSAILSSWLDIDFTAAKDWVEKLPPGPVRDNAVPRVVWRLAARGDSDQAAEWINQMPEADRGRLAADLASNLARDDPPNAARWLEHLAPEGDALDLFSSVAAGWARKDFQGAGHWVNELAAGDARDCAVASFAREAVRVDPAGAATWAATASNDRARASILAGVLREWSQRDAGEAQRWLQNAAGLSAEAKEAIREYLR